ncbi:MAG: GDP-mannose 4,6-dehydratase, partial [Actinomycetota bacterium]|nr:GDP-mannose 4,6-dehydratase [Actinomycetota bacterium]
AYGMVIPRLVRQAVAGGPLTVFGDGLQSRCFGHVADVVDCLVHLLANPDANGEVFNVGSQEEVTILELAKRIAARTGDKSAIEMVPYDKAYPGDGYEDMRRRVPDTAKVQALTGWRPTRSLDDILTETIAEAENERAAIAALAH